MARLPIRKAKKPEILILENTHTACETVDAGSIPSSAAITLMAEDPDERH